MSDIPLFDQSPRLALAALSTGEQVAWRLRYCSQEGLEMRVRATLARVADEIRVAGRPVTIRMLWIELVERAAESGEPDVRAAAALAGMAMGLRAG